MAGITEIDFQDLIEAWLIDEFGEEFVYREAVTRTDREIDFLVYSPLSVWAIEVENTPEDVIEGTGQAILYGAHEERYTPAVIFPKQPESNDMPEVDIIRSQLRVIEKDPAVLERQYPEVLEAGGGSND